MHHQRCCFTLNPHTHLSVAPPGQVYSVLLGVLGICIVWSECVIPVLVGMGHEEVVVCVQLPFPHLCFPHTPWEPSQYPPFSSPLGSLLPRTFLSLSPHYQPPLPPPPLRPGTCPHHLRPPPPPFLPSDPGPVPILPHHPRDPRRVHLPVPHRHAAGEGEGGEGGNDKGINKGLPTRHSFITSHMPPPPQVYMCACTYYALFKINAFNYNKLIVGATTGAALMQV